MYLQFLKLQVHLKQKNPVFKLYFFIQTRHHNLRL